MDGMLDILYGMVEDGMVQKINNFSFALPVSNFCKVLLLLPAPPRPALVLSRAISYFQVWVKNMDELSVI